MMKRIILLLCFLVLLTWQDLFSQSKTDYKNIFFDAESWILFEAYNDALPIYLELNSVYPDNANFKYRIGQCYLNSPGEKAKAISYLEEAVKNIDPDYREGRFSEPGAPYVALYYLANAYRLNNQLDKAIEVYNRFKKVLDPNVYDTAVVNKQMQTCYNARQLIKKPQRLAEHSLGNVINQGNTEYNPVVSEDETMIVFSRSEPFYDALLYSVKENGRWKEPVNMNEILQVDRDIFPTSLSSDGHTLYLYSSADYDGIIYTSNYVNGTWTLPVKLNDNINTKYWESHATVSHDNNRLYFTSNRQGTYGGLDIYVSKRDSNGDWGPASNLGPVINTPFNEESPFLTRDDKTLFFSSKGHYNMGGYDIFYSDILPGGKWSEPVNVGYPLNTTDDDVFYKPSVDKYRGFYSFISTDDQGKRDIYEVEFYPQDRPRIFTITGKSGVEGITSRLSDSIKITVKNIRQPARQMVFYTNPKTQIYRFDLPEGEYRLTYEGHGGAGITRDINLPRNYPHDKFIIPDTKLHRTDFTAELPAESDKEVLMTVKDSEAFVPEKVEPESMLSVRDSSGDELIAPESIPAQTIQPQAAVKGKGSLWIVWIAAGIILAVTVIILIGRRKKK